MNKSILALSLLCLAAPALRAYDTEKAAAAAADALSRSNQHEKAAAAYGEAAALAGNAERRHLLLVRQTDAYARAKRFDLAASTALAAAADTNFQPAVQGSFLLSAARNTRSRTDLENASAEAAALAKKAAALYLATADAIRIPTNATSRDADRLIQAKSRTYGDAARAFEDAADNAEALRCFSLAGAVEGLPSSRVYDCLRDKADFLFRTKDYAAAYAAATNLVARAPDVRRTEEAWKRLGAVEIARTNLTGATRAYFLAAEANPSPGRSLREIFDIAARLQRAKDYTAALDVAAAIAMIGNLSTGNLHRVRMIQSACHRESGRIQEAIEYAEKALELKHRVGNTVHELAALHSKAGGYKKALAFYRDIIADRDRHGFTDQDVIDIYGWYVWDCYRHLEGDEMIAAAKAMKRLGAKNYGYYGGRIEDAILAYEDLKTFPMAEKDIHFPKTIADFGVAMTNGTVHAKDFGWNPTNATECLQKAFDSGASTVVVDNMGSPWFIRKVFPRSNQQVILRKGVRIHGDHAWEHMDDKAGDMFVFKRVKNVVFAGEGDVVVGKYLDYADRARRNRTYASSAFAIDDCENIGIRNMRIAENGMDAIAFGGLGIPNRNTYFEDLELDSNFRQACSICSANRVFFRRVKFNGTTGAEPLSGIDMEPAEVNQGNASVYLFDCEFTGNMGAGLLLSTSSLQPISVYAKRSVFNRHPNGALNIFIRSGLYMGNDKKVPGRTIFEDCEFHGFSDIPAIIIDSASLIDLTLRNCKIIDDGVLRHRSMRPDAPAIAFRLTRDFYYEKGGGNFSKEGDIVLDGVAVTGFTNAPAIGVIDRAGHYSIRNLRGSIDYNGRKLDAGKFSYRAPDRPLADVPALDTAPLHAPVAAPPEEGCAPAYGLKWDCAWFQAPPAYTYVIHGVEGRAAEIDLRYPQWVPGDKAARLRTPSGETLELGTLQNGANHLAFTFPETGWYTFTPPARHLVDRVKGFPFALYAGSSPERKINIDAKLGYTGYFEVPGGGYPATFKVCSGIAEIRNARGELVGRLDATGNRGSQYLVAKSEGERAEVWSFTLPNPATVKFFAPFNGIWADSPGALPLEDADAILCPVVKIEAAKTEEAPAASDLSRPFRPEGLVAQVVERTRKDRLAWAEKGEYTARAKELEASLLAREAKARSDIEHREIEDGRKTLARFQALADMEAKIPKETEEQAIRASYCQAFAVIFGTPPDIGRQLLESLAAGENLAVTNPVVYWWIYKKPYESYIRSILSEYNLGFEDFTVLVKDYRDLDKLIPVLERQLAPMVPKGE